MSEDPAEHARKDLSVVDVQCCCCAPLPCVPSPPPLEKVKPYFLDLHEKGKKRSNCKKVFLEARNLPISPFNFTKFHRVLNSSKKAAFMNIGETQCVGEFLFIFLTLFPSPS